MVGAEISGLTVRQATKKISSLALTMAGTQLINVSSGFLCMVMLAHLGHTVLAASALMISTQVSLMVIGMSILFSLSVLIGHAYGSKNFLGVGAFLQQGWTLALLISIPIMLLFWFIGPILRAFGESPVLIPYITSYFHAYIWAVLPFQLSICNQQLCFGTHQQRMVMITSIFGVTVLLVMAYVLIFGHWGFPALGVAGLGYAMTAQAWSGLIVLTLLLYHREDFKQFDLFSYRVHKNLGYFRQMFKIGWPMSVQMSAEMVSFWVSALMVGWIGANALAAYQIINQYMFLTVVPVFALSQTIGIVVGQARGAGQIRDINQLCYAGVSIALAWSISVALAFLLIPKLLASLYLNIADPANAETLRLVVWLFVIVAFSQIIDGFRNLITGALRGLFDTRFPMLMGIIGLWVVSLPLAYTLAFICHWGVFGIAIGSLIGMSVGAVAIFWRWRYQTALLVSRD